jgi:hypothetical protein
MDSKRLLLFVLLVACALTVLVASQQGSTRRCPGGVCPTCPGGACPKPYQALEAYYQSVAAPAVDIPEQYRVHNYSGGSCAHATTETLLHWVGQHELAVWWRNTYAGAENSHGHEQKLREAGLKYVMTTDGDVQLLTWALATRRGAGIAWPARHCTALVGYEDGQAVIEDNNHPAEYTRVPWDRFVREWQGLGGWAFALVYNPPAPVPRSPTTAWLLPSRRLTLNYVR